MAQYKVITYEAKGGLFGNNVEKADAAMEKFLNEMSAQGWECISISNMDTASKNFIYKIVFKK